jgi:XTP/dITP diphosphohydrolase
MSNRAAQAFVRLIEIMATLRSPDGCPWDREQTIDSLKPFVLEETYEVLHAIDRHDHTSLCEELGDFMFEAVFLAQMEAEAGRFTIADSLQAIVDKLVRRHPHVFGEVTVADADEVNANWDKIKSAERGDDASIFHGVPMGQPALSLAAKLQRRAAKAGAPEDLFADEGVGAELFALVARLRDEGRDPEADLRAAARRFHDRVRAWEDTDGE